MTLVAQLALILSTKKLYQSTQGATFLAKKMSITLLMDPVTLPVVRNPLPSLISPSQLSATSPVLPTSSSSKTTLAPPNVKPHSKL
jgi:hypothetical protein